MNSLAGNSRRPDITFHANGRIDISAHVAHRLSLRCGDVIDVAADDGLCRELYLHVKFRAPVVGRHHATCFPSNHGGCHFRAWSVRLCRAVLAAACVTACKASFAVGEPVTLHGEPALPVIYKKTLDDNDTRY